jgi:ADP-ribose pyrophosphatase YjhB (NUDIX family)
MLIAFLVTLFIVAIFATFNSLLDHWFWKKWENNKRNFMFRWFGKKLWYSRAPAAVGCVFYEDDNNVYVLANKRGSGTPDWQGCWSAPCGYVDFNETCEEACSRELREETGVYIPSQDLTLVTVDSHPEHDKRQNVVFRYGIIIPKEKAESFILTDKESEENEVADIKWINLDCMHDYDWAFNHLEIIPKVYEGLCRIQEYRNWRDKQK